ncbi:MAG: c-type cytochrome [Gallionella sp.]
MTHPQKIIVAVLSLFLFSSTIVHANDDPKDIQQRIGKGDPAAGKDKSAMCQGCHGEDGNSEAPNFPKLAGQYADYLQKQIRAFQTGDRDDATMNNMAATITERQDLLDITAYFASQKQMKGPGGNSEAGKKLFLEGNVVSGVYGCVNCHGENGKGKSPNNALFPVIGGQHKDYLVKQLTELKKGARHNDPAGMMHDIADKMTIKEIEAVADYLSGL